MKLFNKVLEAVDPDFDPVPNKGEGGLGSWEHTKMYDPKGNLPAESDPDAEGLNKISHAAYRFHVKEAYDKASTAET